MHKPSLATAMTVLAAAALAAAPSAASVAPEPLPGALPVFAHDYELAYSPALKELTHAEGPAAFYTEHPLYCAQRGRRFAAANIADFSRVAGVSLDLLRAGRLRCGDVIKVTPDARALRNHPAPAEAVAYLLVVDAKGGPGINVPVSVLARIKPESLGTGVHDDLRVEKADPAAAHGVLRDETLP
ncbi:hypothetical protein ABT160_05345 [Streptomyces sp. NPDC001941]|uniref:hypothetical protein n=1 Tax=Streptomyces sp. NPDC001941 TaxID=3154659 RepID=UPI00331AF7E2